MFERQGRVRNVLEGGNGRLFLGDQDGFAVEWFVSDTPFSLPLSESWRRTLRRRARELKRRGIPYVFCLVPDAHFVYAEDMPPELNASEYAPPGEVFLDAQRGLDGITFVDPRADLVEAKGLLDIYRKTDTHWTQYGSFVGYKTLARALSPLLPMSVLQARDVTFEYRRWFGDLGVRVEPERTEDAPRAKVTRNEYRRVYENDGYKRMGCQETLAEDAAPGRALFFRDSFFTDQAEYVLRSFRHVLTAGTTTSLFLDEVDAWKPHVVVSHVGERRLYSFEWDHRRDGFDDTFRSDFSSPRGRAAQKALLLQEAGRSEEALAAIEGFEADPDLRHDHAYVAAQVLVAAGLFARAAAAIEVGLASYPGRASYLSVAAMIAFARGEFRDALALAERAVDAAPYNGHHHQTYSWILLNSGESEMARRHLAATLRHIDDFSVLWYQSSLACEAVGDKLGASDAIVQALMLDSGEATFRKQAMKVWRN